MTCLLIAKDDADLDKWMRHSEVQELAKSLKQVVRLPNPVFPPKLKDHAGNTVVGDQNLLDIFTGRMVDEMKSKPASCGAIHSHRNCWLWAENHCPTEWIMIVEDDVIPRENCVDKILVVLHALKMQREATVMCMLAGSDAPGHVQNHTRNSTSVFHFHMLLDVRTYPSEWHHKFIVPIHVSMGLKWYILSPKARRVLLPMKVPFPSFERVVWKCLFDNFQRHPRGGGNKDPKKMDCVLTASPVLAASPIDFQDAFHGSGVKRTDAGHEVRPHILIDPIGDWSICERLNTLTVCLCMANALGWGIVMIWEKTANVPISFENLAALDPAIAPGEMYVSILRDRRGGGYSQATTYGDVRLKIRQPLLFIPTWDRIDTMLRAHNQFTDSMSWEWNPAYWLKIKSEWTDKLFSELPRSGMSHTQEWPDDLFILLLPTTRDMHAFTLNGRLDKGFDGYMGNDKDTKFLIKTCELLRAQIEQMIKDFGATRIILLHLDTKRPPALWEDLLKDMRRKFRDNFVEPDFMPADTSLIPRTKYDARYETEGWKHWGQALAKAVGLLSLAPETNILHPILSWSAMWNQINQGPHGKSTIPEIIDSFYDKPPGSNHPTLKYGPAGQLTNEIRHNSYLRQLADEKERDRDGLWNILAYTRWVAREFVAAMVAFHASPFSAAHEFVDRRCLKAFDVVPLRDRETADFSLRCEMGKASQDKQLYHIDDAEFLADQLVNIRNASKKYTDEATQSGAKWSWTEAFVMVILNEMRWQNNKFPFMLDAKGHLAINRGFRGNWSKLFNVDVDFSNCRGQRSPSRASGSARSTTTRRTERSPTPVPSVKRIRLVPKAEIEY